MTINNFVENSNGMNFQRLYQYS